VNDATAREVPGASARRPPATGGASPARSGTRLLLAGTVAFAAVIAVYLAYKFTRPSGDTVFPEDLNVYRIGGLIVRHVSPWYNPHLSHPLYDWPGYGPLHLQFTYTPFAAVVFAPLSFIGWVWLVRLSELANVGFLLLTLWFTFGALNYRSWRVRAGATLVTAAFVFPTEPVLRNIDLGQINLALMALIVWDMTQPDRRRWKGAGVGIAAGIKLVPLIFIPYLLVTRRFRQAVVAAATFAATIVLGFIVLPADSAKWWFTGMFFNGGSRAGFIAWEGNQSLRGITARLMGSIAGSEHVWLVVAVLAIVAGLACAAVLDRKGHRMAGLLATALTGLLASPISWDHHWVWIAPGVALAGHYAVRTMAARIGGAAAGQAPAQTRAARWRGWVARARLALSSAQAWAYGAVAAGLVLVFLSWPGALFGKPQDNGNFSFGLIYLPPGTGMATYERFGDRPRFAEYHWHGLNLLLGNAWVLSGLALLALLALLAWRAPGPRARAPEVQGAGAGLAAGGSPAAVSR
jgi:alpha-1,2-mannosyltransferase